MVPRKSVANHNIITRTWSFKYNRDPYWSISNFKAHCFVCRYVQKRISPKPLNMDSKMVELFKAELFFILKYITGFQSQSIDFKNDFIERIFQKGNNFIGANFFLGIKKTHRFIPRIEKENSTA